MTQPKHSVSSARATAYHEAGHAVVAEYLRIAVQHVSLVADDDTLGHVIHSSDDTAWNEIDRPFHLMTGRARRRFEAAIMVALAGVLAEEKSQGGSSAESGMGFGYDPNIEGPHASPPGSDRAYVSDLGRKLIGEPEERSWFLGWLELRTRNMLNNLVVWPQVKAVAEALIARHTLDGNELQAIVGSVFERGAD